MITVAFKCKECGLYAKTTFRHREKTEDLIKWMNETLNPSIRQKHTKESPTCMASKFDLVLHIPEPRFEGDEVWVGMPTDNVMSQESIEKEMNDGKQESQGD